MHALLYWICFLGARGMVVGAGSGGHAPSGVPTALRTRDATGASGSKRVPCSPERRARTRAQGWAPREGGEPT